MRTAIAIIAILTILGSHADARPRHHTPRSTDIGEILSHPAGCPRIAFCGCGVSVRIFGHPVRDLFPAAAYYRYPRTAARAGMVAIFGRHHVAYIESVTASGAILYDPNSGRHLTRRHEASLAGATIVDPNGNSSQSNKRTPAQRMASHTLDPSQPGMAMQYY